MSEMGAADFKAHCLKVMETVRRTRRTVTITKRGVPVVKLVPADPPGNFVLGTLAGTFKSVGDLVSSPLSDEEWKAIAESRIDQGDLGTRMSSTGPRPSHGSSPGRRPGSSRRLLRPEACSCLP